MDSLSMPYNFPKEEQKTIFTTAGETSTSEVFTPSDTRSMSNQGDSVFSPLAPPFQGRGANEILNMMAQQEPRVADTAPSSADIDLMNFRMGNSEYLFDDTMSQTSNNYYLGSNRPESVASTHSNLWTDGSQGPGVLNSRNGEMVDTFEFLLKSLSSANNFVSMLTREQLSVLRSIRPALLYEFLLEIAKVRGDKRVTKFKEGGGCAFCKNNGESEESYMEHVLKDWRGRVLCPVLRDFRCPRCGATGDRAHTIKYCPHNTDNAVRPGLSSRRRMNPPSLQLGGAQFAPLRAPAAGAPLPPAPSPSPSPSPASAPAPGSSFWSETMRSTFGMNH